MAAIRVYILAKELGVPSSAIVRRCQDEGLDVRNHMNYVSNRLAGQIREWFAEASNASSKIGRILADHAGQAVVIVGPPGSGKSDLLRKMLETARDYHSSGVERAVVDSVILRANQSHSAMLITLCGDLSRGRPITSAQEFLKLLHDWTSHGSDKEILVIGVDVEKTLPVDSANIWSQIIPNLPKRVKMIFTQRPDDVLANMDFPNVVRMPMGQLPLPGQSTSHEEQGCRPLSSEADGERQTILGDTFRLGPFAVNLRALVKKVMDCNKAVSFVFVFILVVGAATYKWWIPLLRHSPVGSTIDTSLQTKTQGQSSPGIVTTGPNSPVTVNYGASDNPGVSASTNKLPRSLRDICRDVDSRPLLLREETAKHYIGLRVKRELLTLWEISDENKAFWLAMTFLGEPPLLLSGAWVISFKVERDAYPELVGAKRGLQLHISGIIQDITGSDITLDKVSIEAE